MIRAGTDDRTTAPTIVLFLVVVVVVHCVLLYTRTMSHYPLSIMETIDSYALGHIMLNQLPPLCQSSRLSLGHGTVMEDVNQR